MTVMRLYRVGESFESIDGFKVIIHDPDSEGLDVRNNCVMNVEAFSDSACSWFLDYEFPFESSLKNYIVSISEIVTKGFPFVGNKVRYIATDFQGVEYEVLEGFKRSKPNGRRHR